MRRLLSLAFVAVVALGAIGSAPAESQRLEIRGSTTVYSMTRQMAASFGRDHPDIEVVVTGGGSEEGIAALLSGEADIANSSRFISAAELRLASDRGVYPVPFRIADDCILPIVHNSNRVREISLEQLRGIYAGRIRNWSEVGGADLPIRVISRETTSGTYGVWRDLVMSGEPVVTSQPLRQSSDAVLRAVAANAGAIGYIGLGNLSARIKPLRVDGVMGSIRTVRDGSYRMLKLYYVDDPVPMLRKNLP